MISKRLERKVKTIRARKVRANEDLEGTLMRERQLQTQKRKREDHQKYVLGGLVVKAGLVGYDENTLLLGFEDTKRRLDASSWDHASIAYLLEILDMKAIRLETLFGLLIKGRDALKDPFRVKSWTALGKEELDQLEAGNYRGPLRRRAEVEADAGPSLGPLTLKFRRAIPPELSAKLKVLGLKFTGGAKMEWTGTVDETQIQQVVRDAGLTANVVLPVEWCHPKNTI